MHCARVWFILVIKIFHIKSTLSRDECNIPRLDGIIKVQKDLYAFFGESVSRVTGFRRNGAPILSDGFPMAVNNLWSDVSFAPGFKLVAAYTFKDGTVHMISKFNLRTNLVTYLKSGNDLKLDPQVPSTTVQNFISSNVHLEVFRMSVLGDNIWMIARAANLTAKKQPTIGFAHLKINLKNSINIRTHRSFFDLRTRALSFEGNDTFIYQGAFWTVILGEQTTMPLEANGNNFGAYDFKGIDVWTGCAPNLCHNADLDATLKEPGGNVTIFRSRYFWTAPSIAGITGSNTRALQLNTVWNGLRFVDAAFLFDGTTFLITEAEVVYKSNGQQLSKPLADVFSGLPSTMTGSVDAVIFSQTTSEFYLFGGSSFIRYQTDKMPFKSSSELLSIERFKGFPANIDAALSLKPADNYFFKGNFYFSYGNLNASSASPVSPVLTQNGLLNCAEFHYSMLEMRVGLNVASKKEFVAYRNRFPPRGTVPETTTTSSTTSSTASNTTSTTPSTTSTTTPTTTTVDKQKTTPSVPYSRTTALSKTTKAESSKGFETIWIVIIVLLVITLIAVAVAAYCVFYKPNATSKKLPNERIPATTSKAKASGAPENIISRPQNSTSKTESSSVPEIITTSNEGSNAEDEISTVPENSPSEAESSTAPENTTTSNAESNSAPENIISEPEAPTLTQSSDLGEKVKEDSKNLVPESDESRLL